MGGYTAGVKSTGMISLVLDLLQCLLLFRTPPLSVHRHCKQVCFQLAASEVSCLLMPLKDSAAAGALFLDMLNRFHELPGLKGGVGEWDTASQNVH